jgi:AraC family transcriptional regulator
MQTPLSILLQVLALATSSASSARSGQDAATLLDAQRAGLGAPAALERLGVVRMRGTVVFEGFPAQGSFASTLGPRGEARLEALFDGVPPSLRCTNREVYWMTGTGGLELKRGWSAAADVRLFALARHGDWRAVYASAELVGDAQVAGRACHELRLVPKTPAELGLTVVAGEETPEPDTWWLARDSHELVRVALDATVSGAGWQRLVHDYADWRPVAGVRFPFRSWLSFGPPEHPLRIAFETQSVETGVELDGDPFQPDEPVRAALAEAGSPLAQKGPRFTRETRSPLLTATVRVKCKADEVQQQLAIVMPEVMSYLTREGLAPAGPPFARYHAFGPELDFEAGIPVAQSFAGNARVRQSSLPGGEVVTGMHVGPYQELARTRAALAQWLGSEKLTPAGGPWEIYWTDPGLERDPAKWRTEIVQPLVPR